MLSTSVRTRAAVLMAATLVLTVLGGAGGAGAAQPGELVIPPSLGAPGDSPYYTNPIKLMASAEGIGYEHGAPRTVENGVLLHPLVPVQTAAPVNLQGPALPRRRSGRRFQRRHAIRGHRRQHQHGRASAAGDRA